MTTIDLQSVSDEELLAETARAATRERHATVQLIALLGEVDARRLFLGVGCSSLFTYCTQVLRLAENAAYFRIEAARAARTFPAILDMLARGDLSLTAVRLLRPHLTPENNRELLSAAKNKTKEEVATLVAGIRPLPPVPSFVRKLPPRKQRETVDAPADPDLPGVREPSTSRSAMPPSPSEARSTVSPLAPEHYKIQFTVSKETYGILRQVQQLLRHRVPSGDPGAIFDVALKMLLEYLRRTRLAAAKRPRARAKPATSRQTASRHIPAAVKRDVWARDGGQCAFVGTAGRCTETGFLEFHHVVPFAAGGAATSENVQLRCRAHNVYEGELFFGTDSMLAREMPAEYAAVPSRVRIREQRRRAGASRRRIRTDRTRSGTCEHLSRSA